MSDPWRRWRWQQRRCADPRRAVPRACPSPRGGARDTRARAAYTGGAPCLQVTGPRWAPAACACLCMGGRARGGQCERDEVRSAAAAGARESAQKARLRTRERTTTRSEPPACCSAHARPHRRPGHTKWCASRRRCSSRRHARSRPTPQSIAVARRAPPARPRTRQAPLSPALVWRRPGLAGADRPLDTDRRDREPPPSRGRRAPSHRGEGRGSRGEGSWRRCRVKGEG